MADFRSFFRRLTTAERLESYNLRPDVLKAAQTMVTDQRTDHQIGAVGASLTATETVLRMMEGRHVSDRGLLVLTDQRVFWRSRQREGTVAFSVPLAEIETIEGSTRRVIGTVRLTSPDGTFVVDDILGNQGESLAEEARQAIAGTSTDKPDAVQELLRLRTMRDSGSISAADFEARKRELWDGI